MQSFGSKNIAAKYWKISVSERALLQILTYFPKLSSGFLKSVASIPTLGTKKRVYNSTRLGFRKIALLQNTPKPFAIQMFMIWKPKKKSTNWDTSYGLMAISSVKIPVFDDFSTPRWVGTQRNPQQNPNTSCESKEYSCAMRMRSAETWHRINFWMIIVMILIKYYDDILYHLYIYIYHNLSSWQLIS